MGFRGLMHKNKEKGEGKKEMGKYTISSFPSPFLPI
jgi:hypothetical protein